jgi:hypothetical protein
LFRHGIIEENIDAAGIWDKITRFDQME